MFSGQLSIALQRTSAGTIRTTVPQPDEWEIPASEVIMEKLLGEGAFGEVYKGVVKCPITNPKVRLSVKNSLCTPVAVKLLKCKQYYHSYRFCQSHTIFAYILQNLYGTCKV